MTAAAGLFLVLGLAVTTVLVVGLGAGDIWHGIAALGWGGFAAVTSFHLGVIGEEAAAWWLLGRDRAGWLRFAWGRMVRDSASEILPLSQVGGYVVGARALSLAGVAGGFAAASTVVDVTVELVAQLGYTLIGLALLDGLQPGNAVTGPVLGAVAAMAALVAVFVAVQARGAGAVAALGGRVAAHLLGRSVAGSGAVRTEIQRLHRRPGTLLLACLVHLGGWLMSGVETWLTLRLMGMPVSLAAGLVIDSLLYAMRSLAFMVPNALGVQEAALVLLGGLFGLAPDTALALSLIKRGRDLVISVPALLAWQVAEGRRAWGRLAIEPGAETLPSDG